MLETTSGVPEILTNSMFEFSGWVCVGMRVFLLLSPLAPFMFDLGASA
jgi:hypothetical protein